jgi:hypothetical protein
MMLQNIAIGILFGMMVVLLIDLHLMYPQREPASTQLFGDQFDIWRLAKVNEREAAQTIRRAHRLGYKLIQYMTDQAGSTYILFQLCPPRRQLLEEVS